jgi:hypothetical protein
MAYNRREHYVSAPIGGFAEEEGRGRLTSCSLGRFGEVVALDEFRVTEIRFGESTALSHLRLSTASDESRTGTDVHGRGGLKFAVSAPICASDALDALVDNTMGRDVTTI